ncbi:MAG TPA: transcriptional regulator [Chloroflexi bacterium]|nr:transcriptional regulator [Chloroflexota bacterium]
MSTQQPQATEEGLRDLARYFYTLKDVLRLRILITLADNVEMTVTELAQTLRVSQPLISFHLRPLRTFGLVKVRRAGREVYCSIDMDRIKQHQDEFMDLLIQATT